MSAVAKVIVVLKLGMRVFVKFTKRMFITSKLLIISVGRKVFIKLRRRVVLSDTNRVFIIST